MNIQMYFNLQTMENLRAQCNTIHEQKTPIRFRPNKSSTNTHSVSIFSYLCQLRQCYDGAICCTFQDVLI